MSEQGTVASIAGLLAETLRPLRIALGNQDIFSGCMRALGWDAPTFIPSIKALELHKGR